jgi:hypothetical protein
MFFLFKERFLGFFQYFMLHCFICRLSDSTVSEDARIEPRRVAILALAVRRSNDAATKRWILQGLHSEMVHHISVYYSTEHVA